MLTHTQLLSLCLEGVRVHFRHHWYTHHAHSCNLDANIVAGFGWTPVGTVVQSNEGIKPLKKPQCNSVHGFETVLVAMLLALLFYREA